MKKNKKESKSLICDKNPHFHEFLEHYMDDIWMNEIGKKHDDETTFVKIIWMIFLVGRNIFWYLLLEISINGAYEFGIPSLVQLP
jgi:hypothetical protein